MSHDAFLPLCPIFLSSLFSPLSLSRDTNLLFSVQDCSLFYTRRFCLACVSQNQSQLPPQIQVELSKKKSRSTIPQTALS